MAVGEAEIAVGSVYKRPETARFWIRYRDEDGRLRRISSHSDQEEEALEQLRLLEATVVIKKRAKKIGELTEAIQSAADGDGNVGPEARLSCLEYRLKALEIIVRQVLINSEGK